MSTFTPANELDDAHHDRDVDTDDPANIQDVRTGTDVTLRYYDPTRKQTIERYGTVVTARAGEHNRDRSSIVIKTDEGPLRLTWNGLVCTVTDRQLEDQLGRWGFIETDNGTSGGDCE